MSAALKLKQAQPSRELQQYHAKKIVPLLPTRRARPRFEVGGLVWWEGRRYCVDGLHLVGSTWVAELIRPQDFELALRVSYSVPAAELIHCDSI